MNSPKKTISMSVAAAMLAAGSLPALAFAEPASTVNGQPASINAQTKGPQSEPAFTVVPELSNLKLQINPRIYIGGISEQPRVLAINNKVADQVLYTSASHYELDKQMLENMTEIPNDGDSAAFNNFRFDQLPAGWNVSFLGFEDIPSYMLPKSGNAYSEAALVPEHAMTATWAFSNGQKETYFKVKLIYISEAIVDSGDKGHLPLIDSFILGREAAAVPAGDEGETPATPSDVEAHVGYATPNASELKHEMIMYDGDSRRLHLEKGDVVEAYVPGTILIVGNVHITATDSKGKVAFEIGNDTGLTSDTATVAETGDYTISSHEGAAGMTYVSVTRANPKAGSNIVIRSGDRLQASYNAPGVKDDGTIIGNYIWLSDGFAPDPEPEPAPTPDPTPKPDDKGDTPESKDDDKSGDKKNDNASEGQKQNSGDTTAPVAKNSNAVTTTPATATQQAAEPVVTKKIIYQQEDSGKTQLSKTDDAGIIAASLTGIAAVAGALVLARRRNEK